MEIRWPNFSPQGEDEPPSPLYPFIFREIMSGAASFVRIRNTRREPVGSLYVPINFSGKKRTWTSAYRTVTTYLKCPSITSATNDIYGREESHRCFTRQPPKPAATPKRISSCSTTPRAEPWVLDTAISVSRFVPLLSG